MFPTKGSGDHVVQAMVESLKRERMYGKRNCRLTDEVENEDPKRVYSERITLEWTGGIKMKEGRFL